MIAMYRLHLGLKRCGVESRILCGRRTIESGDIQELPRLWKLDGLLRRITSRLGLNDIHRIGSFRVLQHDFFIGADVIHLHGIHSGTLSYLALPALTTRKPAVFTLHDMWAMTGHCAYSFDCTRWAHGCGRCPYPDTHPAVKRDSTRLEWRLKQWVYSRSTLTLIAPSLWMAGLAKQSLLHRFPIHYIPNGVDTQRYQPHPTDLCRRILGIPLDKSVLLFGAENLQDPRKGSDMLVKALSGLPDSIKSRLVLLTYGLSGTPFRENLGTPLIHFGYVAHDAFKAVLYSAADLYLLPTRADNAPLVLLESMACGTPVVSFNIGGVPELIEHGRTGYLADPENIEDFGRGIAQLLADEALRRSMRDWCRRVVLARFNQDLHIERHLHLYRQVLQA